MKILYAITKSNFGGAQRYVFELANKLKQDGHDVVVAAGGKGLLKDRLQEQGIKVLDIDSAQRDISILKEIKVALSLYRIIKEEKPDVLHLHSPKIGGLGALIGRFTGVKKIIYTNHGWPFNEDRPLWQVVLIKTLSWFTLFLNHKTIILSKIENEQIKNWPLLKNKSIVIPNAITEFKTLTKDEALNSIIKSEYIKNRVTKEKPFIIGTIGELHKNKGLNFAIEGIKSYMDQYPESSILYIIIGEGEKRHELEKLILKNKLENIVYLVGSLQNAREYLKAFDIFLISSIKEGLPYVLLEAGYAEVPVITTSVGGIPEVVENLKEAFIIAPKRPQEIKNVIFYSMEHRDDLRKISKNFKQKVSINYNFDKLSKEIINLYKANY